MFQVAIPIGHYDKCPVSVSFVAKHGGDRFLLDTVQSIYGTLQEQVAALSKSKASHDTDNREISAELAKEKVDCP